MGIETAERVGEPAGHDQLLPLAAAAVTVVLWASAFVAIRYLGPAVSPGALTLGRLLVGSIVLGAFVLTRPTRWPGRGDWPLLLTCGLLWFGVYNVALNAGEQHVDAGTAAMLVNIGPILIAILAGLMLGEGFPGRLLIGSGVAFAGVVVIGLSTSSSAGADAWGVVLCVVAAVTYAIGVISQKPLLARLPALEVTWLACLIGAVACLPFAPELLRDVEAASAPAIVWLIYLGAFPTALAFTTWAYALARTSAGKLGTTTYLVPPLAVVMGWAMLGETPALLALGGGGLCLIGVYISRGKRSGRGLGRPR